MSGVATSFQAQAIHFRFAPDYRRIAGSQQMTFGAQSRHFALRKNSEAILGTPQVTASFTGLLGSTALERRLFCDPSSSIEYDAVTNPYCSRRSDNGIYPSAWVLAEIADLLPIVSNECPKNIRILG